MNKYGRIALKAFLWFVASVIVLFLLIIFLIRIPAVQNYVVGKVTHYVSDKIGTPVSIGYINITFPKKLVLENVYFEDQSKDTLIAGEKLMVDINMLKLLQNTVEVQSIDLEGITAKIQRTLPDSSFNFDYIINAFTTEQKPSSSSDTSSALQFNINDVVLKRIHVLYNDEVIGTRAAIQLKHFDSKVKKFDLSKNMAFALPKIKIDGLQADIKQWQSNPDSDLPKAEDFGIEQTVAEAASSLLPDIDIKQIDLSDIHVRYADNSSAMDTKFDIQNFAANIHKIDLNLELVQLGKLVLSKADAAILMGKVQQQKTASQPSTKPANWVVSADKIVLQEINAKYVDNNQARMQGFDYGNIAISNLQGELTDLYYSSDSISGSLKSLMAKDRSGFNLKKLQGDFVYTEQGAIIKNLLAQTPRTTIRDYIKISYPSLDAISKNPGLISIDAKIKKSTIDMRDMLYFAPELTTIDAMKPLVAQHFYIDGNIKGRVDNLSIPHLEFKALDKTHVIASASIKGLPDVDKLNIDLNIKKLTTGRGDIVRLVDKSLLPDNFVLPNSISLVGTFKGGTTGFDTKLKLITEKGNASVNGNLNMGRDTTYDAYVTIDNFNIGSLLDQDSVLGQLSAEARVTGTGLNPKTMNSKINGKLNMLEAMGYTYRNIDLDIDAMDGDIAGKIISPDPNLQVNLNFAADMRNLYPKVHAEVMIDSVNLKNLKLLDDDLRYHGKIVADFETADINHLNGSIIVSKSSIAYNNERFTLDSVSLIAKADTNRNTLILKAGFLDAHLVGRYKLTELGSSIQDILQMYYNPKGLPPSKVAYSAQNFEFSANLRNTKFIRDFLPKLESMQDISLDGTFNSETKSLMAKLIAPKLVYDGMLVQDIGIDLTTADSTLYYSALINKIKVNNIELNNTVFSGSVFENNLDFGLWVKDAKDKERYHLGAKMRVTENNYILSLNEDGLMLNYDKWQIDPSNALSFGTAGMRAHNFRLLNDGQELLIQSQDSVTNSPINLSFNNFRIETLTEILDSESLNLGGSINGSATVSRLESTPVFVSDIKIEKFYFGQDTIGNILVKVNNIKENTFSTDIRVTENGNDIQLIGDFVSPPEGKGTINAKLSLKPMKLSTIQAFSMGYLEDSEGDLSGELLITGALDAPRINGNATFNEAKINIAMLNADLKMDKQTIYFNDQGIQFKQFEIKDIRGNSAKINGSIKTSSYTDFVFNLNLSTDDFAAVNSTREDNDLFYGKLYITSNLRITGNLDKPRIDGNVKANNKTDFVFIVPNDDPGIAQRDGVVKFVNRSDTAATNVFAKLDSMTTATRLSGYDIALNLSTDRDAKFKVVLDEGTNDALLIQGVAELNTTIDASDKITMSGTFTVEKGKYSFSFGPITKDFGFSKGSTITWNGDPLDAQLNITALYTNKFSSLELVQSQIGSENQNLYKQRIPFDVKLILTGELFKPIINFDIDLDENNAIASQDVISKVNIALANLREDPAELNKQVFSLIALGRFMSANPFESLSGGGTESLVRSTVSSLLTSQLNNLASDLIQGVELDFNLQSEEDYLTGAAETRTDLNVGISKMLFDDRLKITIGSNFEVEGNSRPGEKSANIAGDISLEYQLSKDGRYFARVYRKDQYQATLQGQFVETGIGFIINMSYDRFRELFMSSKALDQYYNTESKGFRRRFDVERMEVDSIYRDSVRLIIRDSLMQHSPEYRKRIEEREKDSIKPEPKNNKPADIVADTTRKAIRNEEDERSNNEK